MILYMNKQILFLFGIFLSIIILATFFKGSSVYERFQEGIKKGEDCNFSWTAKCDKNLTCKPSGIDQWVSSKNPWGKCK